MKSLDSLGSACRKQVGRISHLLALLEGIKTNCGLCSYKWVMDVDGSTFDTNHSKYTSTHLVTMLVKFMI